MRAIICPTPAPADAGVLTLSLPVQMEVPDMADALTIRPARFNEDAHGARPVADRVGGKYNRCLAGLTRIAFESWCRR